uniref:C-type lectin domain-containing protein n=1 Tax=Plectus sambesii TaxID=2011161 RepID=A0A914VDE5_9BILA
MCASMVKSWGGTCRVGFIKSLNDVIVLIDGGLIKAYDKFYVGLKQTNTSGAAGDGWSWDDFSGLIPATPLWATGQPTDVNNTKSFAAYTALNGLVDVDSSTFVPTGFFCQCSFPFAPVNSTSTATSTSPTLTPTVPSTSPFLSTSLSTTTSSPSLGQTTSTTVDVSTQTVSQEVTTTSSPSVPNATETIPNDSTEVTATTTTAIPPSDTTPETSTFD